LITAPRPGDAFYLDVTYASGKTTRFTINALDIAAAFYETAYVLGGCGDIYVSDPSVSGTLCRVNGDVVATGNTEWFEARS
jgi:hypothetical protein